jgi:spermidine synthase/Tfp pilus assembly protein PilF
VAGEGYIARGDQKMLGHFGVLLNPYARDVLSVGFGAGETTACLADHRLKKIDCVEIAPEIVNVSLKFFRHLNLADRLDEEVKMIFMDAKNYLHLTDSSYDVIVNDSIHPRDFAENSSLYAKEYFESAREHLNENGIIMSWLPTYDMPYSAFKSVIGTLMDVFPYVTLWYPTVHPAPLVLIIGSESQQYFSPKHIENEMLKPGVRESLSEIDMHNSVHILSCYVGDQEDLQKVVEGSSTNSDFFPFVEFTTQVSAPENLIFADFIMNVRGDSIYGHIDWSGFSEEEKDKWRQSFGSIHDASRHLFMALCSTVNLDKLRHCVDGLAVLPDYPAIRRTKLDVEGQLYVEGISMMESGDGAKALELAGEILKVEPQSVTAWAITALARQANGDKQGALAAARLAAQIAPNDPQTHLHVGLVLHDMGRYDDAIAEYKVMLRLAEQTGKVGSYKLAQMLEPIAAAYMAAGRLDEAEATAEKALELARASRQPEMVKHMQWRLKSIRMQQAAR